MSDLKPWPQGGHPSWETLADYAADELDGAEALEVAVHVNSCRECLAELSGLRRRWERLTEWLATALPEPGKIAETRQKREIARRVREFLAAYRPEELPLFETIWDLLGASPLPEIARARPQAVRGDGFETICVPLISTLAAVLEEETAEGLSEIPQERAQALLERRARERGLAEDWTGRWVEFLLRREGYAK